MLNKLEDEDHRLNIAIKSRKAMTVKNRVHKKLTTA